MHGTARARPPRARLPRRDPALDGAAAHVVGGNVDWALAGTLLLGALPGVWLGSYWRPLRSARAHEARPWAGRRLSCSLLTFFDGAPAAVATVS